MKNILANVVDIKEYYITQLDGNIIGYVHKSIAAKLVDKLRIIKIAGKLVPNMLEIVLVPFKSTPSQFPGLFLFTGPTRMMRPLYNLAANEIEFIGTFEQVIMAAVQ